MIPLFIVLLFNNAFVIFNFFSRINAIQTKKWALSNAIFQIIYIAPKFLALIIIPLIVYNGEYLIEKNESFKPLFYHFLIICEIIGLWIGIINLKYFLASFKKIVMRENDSLAILDFINLYIFTFFKFNFNFLKKKSLSDIFSIKNYSLFFHNVLIGFLFSISVPLLMSLSISIEEYRATFVALIPIIGGIAFTLMTYFIEPKISYLADKVYENKGSIKDLYILLFDCIKGKMLGCIIALLTLQNITKTLELLFLKISS
jgi:hypothetical protein